MVAALYRATATCFWLLLLASQLPVVGGLWVASGPLRMPDLFRGFVADVVRRRDWR